MKPIVKVVVGFSVACALACFGVAAYRIWAHDQAWVIILWTVLGILGLLPILPAKNRRIRFYEDEFTYRTWLGNEYRFRYSDVLWYKVADHDLYLYTAKKRLIVDRDVEDAEPMRKRLAACNIPNHKPVDPAISDDSGETPEAVYYRSQRTPITVIMANNSILRSNTDSPPAERAQWLDSTDEAGRDMMHMIDEMLTLSNLESVGRSVVTAPLDFSSAAEKAVLQLESLAYERGVEIASEIAEGVTVRGNAEYCTRICSGLLENALKYEPVGGRVTLTLGTERKRAVLSVRNQGSFIAPEDLPHIFERFYRSDKARGSRGGHGLGLPIIRQMAGLLGGEVTAESSAETGTLFTVTLPIAE